MVIRKKPVVTILYVKKSVGRSREFKSSSSVRIGWTRERGVGGGSARMNVQVVDLPPVLVRRPVPLAPVLKPVADLCERQPRLLG